MNGDHRNRVRADGGLVHFSVPRYIRRVLVKPKTWTCPLRDRRLIIFVSLVAVVVLMLAVPRVAPTEPADGSSSKSDKPPVSKNSRDSKDSKASCPAAKKKVEPADNSYCYACHVNYQGEKFTGVHGRAGIGCEKCHGTSVKHSGDEDNLTPPERMFPKTEIDKFCMTCHEEKSLRKSEVHQEWFKEPAGETCGDCHTKTHRLKVRTRVWDKKTGKLLTDDGVRMMQKDSPATSGPTESPAKK